MPSEAINHPIFQRKEHSNLTLVTYHSSWSRLFLSSGRHWVRFRLLTVEVSIDNVIEETGMESSPTRVFSSFVECTRWNFCRDTKKWLYCHTSVIPFSFSSERKYCLLYDCFSIFFWPDQGIVQNECKEPNNYYFSKEENKGNNP